jgi:hypothetical protein
MSKSKCTCPPDYDCCVCGFERAPKRVKGIKQTPKPIYCHNCLDDGALIRLVLKPTEQGRHRELYCSRCAKLTGAGYYSDNGGYDAQKARKKLARVRKEARRIAKRSTVALDELGK